LEIKAEDMEIDPPYSMDGVGLTDAPEDWSIVFRSKKRPKKGKDGRIDITDEEFEEVEEEEEDVKEESDHQQKIDKLSR
jgi:hypothetical protein